MPITYTPSQWLDDSIAGPYGPINGARLNNLEAGVAAATTEVNTARSETITLARISMAGAAVGKVMTDVGGVAAWATPAGGGGGSPTGAAGGDLAGSTYPNPTLRSTLQDPVAGTAGLRTLGTGAQQALNAPNADLRYAPQWPGLVCTGGGAAAIFASGAASTVGGANQTRTARVVIPKSGTLHDMAIWIVGNSGNIEVGILDTSATRNRLWTTGSITCPSSTGQWTVIGDPGLTVTQGEELEFYLGADNNTATFKSQTMAGGVASLPSNFLPGVAAAPKLAAQITAFPLGTTVTEGSMGQAGVCLLMIARVA